MLSHELRTPLTPVLIAVSSMLESDPDPALLPALEMIRRNIELEARLIDDLLDLSRIARGRLRLDLEVVDIHQVIRRAVEICRDETFVAGLEVVTELEALHHHVTADHARMMQIAWNLVRNAAKFTPPDGRLDHPHAPTHPSRRALLLGRGPPPPRRRVRGHRHRHRRLRSCRGSSMRSSRATTTSAAGRGGLGLGLAISRSLAEAMGGQLTASSRGRGLGSTFRLELTTMPAAGNSGRGRFRRRHPDLADERACTGRTCGSSWSRTIRIPSRFLAPCSAARGHDVVTADRVARPAPRWTGPSVPFDLLLSDIELPDGDGLELMRELSDRAPT